MKRAQVTMVTMAPDECSAENRSHTLPSRGNGMKDQLPSIQMNERAGSATLDHPVVPSNDTEQQKQDSHASGKSGLNPTASRITVKSITTPCLRKLRSTLSLGQRDSRREPVNQSCNVLNQLNQHVDPMLELDENDLNPPLSVRSLSTPALNLETNQSTTTQQLTNNQQQIYPSYPLAQPINGQLTANCNDHLESMYMRDVCSKYFTRDELIGPRPLLPMSSHQMSTQQHQRSTPQINAAISSNSSPSSCINNNYNMDQYRVTCFNGSSNQQQSVQHRFVEVCRANDQQTFSSTTTNSQPINSITSSPPDSSILGQHVVVVSSYEQNNRDHGLTVKPSPLTPTAASNSPVSDYVGENTLNHAISAASSQDLTYKSSSESGRGTMKSDTSSNVNPNSVSPPLDHTSLDSDQSGPLSSSLVDPMRPGSGNPSLGAMEKMQAELQQILDDGVEVSDDDLSPGVKGQNGLRLPVVHESDSWVSESSRTCDEIPQKKFTESTTTNNKDNNNKINNQQTKVSKMSDQCKSVNNINNNNNKIEKTPSGIKTGLRSKSRLNGGSPGKIMSNGIKSSCQLKKWRVPLEDIASVTTGGMESLDYPDYDLTSEYTANTDNWDNGEIVNMRKQLSGLENMYSEILNLLGSRMHGAKRYIHHSSSGKLNKRMSGSVSSLTGRSSVASRDHFYSRGYKYLHQKDDLDSRGARRMKRLEGHVITLARSVAQLSSEIRTNHCLMKDVETLRKDVDRIQDQLKCIKVTPLIDSGTLRRNQNSLVADSKEAEKFRADIMGPGNKNNKFDKIKRFFGDEPPILRQFLKKLGYEKYASKLESEKIGLKELMFLNEEKLAKLGIPMGPRNRIIQELHKLKPTPCNIYLV